MTGLALPTLAGREAPPFAPQASMLFELASALEYPGDRTLGACEAAAAQCADEAPEMARALSSLARWLKSAGPGEPEERYTALFDLSPVCTLHAGYHLFGEAYQRGALLAGLATEIRSAGLPDNGELPDYLPTLLRLVARTTSIEDREVLVDALLLPALVRMTEALGESKNPWADVVRALPSVLGRLGSGTPLPPPPLPMGSTGASMPGSAGRPAPDSLDPAWEVELHA